MSECLANNSPNTAEVADVPEVADVVVGRSTCLKSPQGAAVWEEQICSTELVP